jgi:hypothetical protein
LSKTPTAHALDGRTWIVLVSATLVFAMAVPFVPLLRGPGPYPPEWQWEPRSLWAGGVELASRLLGPLGAGAALLGLLVASGSTLAGRRPRLAAALLVAAAVPAGWALQLGLVGLDPAGALRTLVNRATSRSITSYHDAALMPEARDPVYFLRRHHELLAELRTSAKHAATHPPGPVLYYRGLMALCEESPGLTRWALAAIGDTPDRRFAPPNSPAARAAALIGALMLGLLCAATTWPVAALAWEVTGDALAAARVGILWNLLPGPVLMTPQFDQAVALPVAGAAALLAWSVRTVRPVAPAVLAGLCGGLALFVTYGAAAFLLIGGAAALALGLEGGWLRPARAAAWALSGAGAVVLITVLLGHHPLRSALTAVAIHHKIYTAPRSYALWLLFNPLDLAIFFGIPLTILLALRAGHSSLALRAAAGALSPADRFVIAVGAGLALLVFSGVARGEVGRIWIPLTPFLLVAALARSRDGGQAGARPSRREALLLGALLLPLSIVLRLSWRQ